MTYLDAAYQGLKQAKQPLHYKEITHRALEQGLIEPRGLTPEATMGSRLYTDTKQEDHSAPHPPPPGFVRPSPQRGGDLHVRVMT